MKFVNWFKSLFLVASTFVFFQCSAQKPSQKNKELSSDSKGELLIYIQQNPCMGKCPNYEASFYSGKILEYNGKAHMPLIGKYEYLVPPDLTKNLIFQAVKMNLKLVPDSISIPPDVPVTRIWIVINGKMKKIVGWMGSGNETFQNFVKLVSTEVKAMITEQEGRKIP